MSLSGVASSRNWFSWMSWTGVPLSEGYSSNSRGRTPLPCKPLRFPLRLKRQNATRRPIARPTRAHPIAIPAVAPVEIPVECDDTGGEVLDVEVGTLLVPVFVFVVAVVVVPEVAEVLGVVAVCVDGVEGVEAVGVEAAVVDAVVAEPAEMLPATTPCEAAGQGTGAPSE